ncbi:MAG TPA: hypothetical protein VEC16_07110 [Alphaproteobacteria bacterium]|nr:hypothetical protein [Alphaproteobacteria bacterium]
MNLNLEEISKNIPSKEKIDKGILYTTAILFLDYMVGHALYKQPLHEALGMHLPEYANNIEMAALGFGWLYSMKNPKK